MVEVTSTKTKFPSSVMGTSFRLSLLIYKYVKQTKKVGTRQEKGGPWVSLEGDEEQLYDALGHTMEIDTNREPGSDDTLT
jgi:hypothetical protein